MIILLKEIIILQTGRISKEISYRNYWKGNNRYIKYQFTTNKFEELKLILFDNIECFDFNGNKIR